MRMVLSKDRLAALAIFVCAAPTLAVAQFKPDVATLKAEPVEIAATVIASFNRIGAAQSHFGRLDWRGGLVLTSPSPNFGGWSGLVMDPDGNKFISISDSGVWLTGELTYAGDKPQGIANAKMGPLLNPDGKPFKRGRDRDAEAIALVDGSVSAGSVLVAFERNHRIVGYDVSKEGLSAARRSVPLPEDAKRMSRNNGLEAMTVMRGGPYKGATIAMSEHLLDKNGNHTGWIWAGAAPQRFNFENIGEFDLTDLASLEDGTLFVLERRFRWLEGVKMRLRRVMPDELLPGRTIKGEILIEADFNSEIDNLEGLAVSHGKPGETIFTMISDDNFNHFLQRTVLLQFSLTEPQTAKARP